MVIIDDHIDGKIDAREAAAALSWWLDAGVDSALTEAPRDWLKPRAEVAMGPAARPPAPVSNVSAPRDFAALRALLDRGAGLPLDRPGATRIAPLGHEGAPLMVMADLPGRDEAEAGRPIGGEAWTLAQKMLAAIGIAADDAYLAALGCFHQPGSRPDADDLRACAALARDHVRLARPRRLLLLGDGPTRALLDESLARARGRVHRVEGVRTVATFHPRWLLGRPGDKALAWRDLLLLIGEEE